MGKIYNCIGLCIIVLLMTSLAGCSEDEDIPKANTEWERLIVGEWYADLGSSPSGIRNQYIIQYFSDGTFSGILSQAASYDGYSIPITGTYKILNKRLVTDNIMLGEKTTETSDILALNKYDMRLFTPEIQVEDLSHRIVDTYHLIVGGTDVIQINDPDFVALDYTSSDNNIATVDVNGNIKAIRAGTAYISVGSNNGTAVIRVVITNPNTYIDDYVTYLGENISKASNAYGNIYNDIDDEDGTMRRRYFLIDDNIKIIDFSYDCKSNQVVDITMNLQNNADVEKIIASFSDYYTFILEEDNIYYFKSIKNLRTVRIFYYASYHVLEFCFNTANDPFAVMDDLIRMSASEAANQLKHSITNKEKTQGRFVTYVNNIVFYKVRIDFDAETDRINHMTLYCWEDLTISDIEFWYKENYIFTGVENQYGQLNPLLLIQLTTNEDDGTVHVMYTQNG